MSIPKPNGGERKLGIPTVLDRLIQQTLNQVLSPIFESTFSEHSCGFRPGRNAHQAVQAALGTIDAWVRRKLRCILWRQWKRPRTRKRYLRRLGLSEYRAWKSSVNGRGPWWNAGSSHMNAAMTNACFDRWGLVSVLDTVLRLQRVP